MTYQYWHNQGTSLRKRFLSFEGGYHGDTFGAMSVGAESHYHDPFRSFFFETDFIPYPDTFERDTHIKEKACNALHHLDLLLSKKGVKSLLHGHTYTANPLGCAVALASLELLLSPECTEARKAIELTHKQGLQELLNHLPAIQMPRVLGTIAAFNYPTNETTKNHLLNKGLLIRPLGDCVYLLPPYCVSMPNIKRSYETLVDIFSR